MSKFTMNNINTQPHEVVATENAFLFTKQHLKTEFPKYFVDEDSIRILSSIIIIIVIVVAR